MKNIKRLLSAMLVLVLAFSFAGCHKKGEIAVKIGEWEFTSAYYMCAFLQANDEAKSLVQEKLSDAEKAATEIDYTSKTVEGKKYETWVRDEAIEYLKEIAAYKTLCKENKLTQEQETLDYYEELIDLYWEDASYGTSMKDYYENNGVSKETYFKFYTDALLSNLYFEHIYGEGGEKEIPIKDVEKEYYENNVLVNVLTANFDENTTDKEKKETYDKFKDYEKQLKNGKKSFHDIYHDYGKGEHSHDTEETDEAKPKDDLATVITSTDENYNTIKGMKKGEVKIIALEGDSGYKLVVKKDIKADKYYLEQSDITVRHTLKDEEYQKFIDEYVKKLTATVNEKAVKPFKVKKIKETA